MVTRPGSEIATALLLPLHPFLSPQQHLLPGLYIQPTFYCEGPGLLYNNARPRLYPVNAASSGATALVCGYQFPSKLSLTPGFGFAVAHPRPVTTASREHQEAESWAVVQTLAKKVSNNWQLADGNPSSTSSYPSCRHSLFPPLPSTEPHPRPISREEDLPLPPTSQSSPWSPSHSRS